MAWAETRPLEDSAICCNDVKHHNIARIIRFFTFHLAWISETFDCIYSDGFHNFSAACCLHLYVVIGVHISVACKKKKKNRD